jgi:hypothetical protein
MVRTVRKEIECKGIRYEELDSCYKGECWETKRVTKVAFMEYKKDDENEGRNKKRF